MKLSCLRCGNTYEQHKRRASHYCEPCRTINKRENDAKRHAERAALKTEMLDQLTEWVQHGGMEDDYAEALKPKVESYLFRYDPHGNLFDAVPDRMPAGSNSPAGPDEGCSTGWTDLAEHLDERARQVAEHPWFAANPHWSYELHDPDVDVDTLRPAA